MQPVGVDGAEVVGPVVIALGEGVGAVDVLDVGEAAHHACGDHHYLVDAHQVEVLDPLVGVVGAFVVEVVVLIRGERLVLEAPLRLAVHAGAGNRDHVVAGELAVSAARGGPRAAVDNRLPVVPPVALLHQVAVLGLDVLRPNFEGVVDVGVAVENGEPFLHGRFACRLAVRRHDKPPATPDPTLVPAAPDLIWRQ